MTFVIGDGCIDIKDRSCVTYCPVDCIYEGERKLYIHPDECIDCGACESACPQNAIFLDATVPVGQEGHLDAAREFFEPLGMPGGSRNIGPQSRDVIPAESGQSSQTG
ncbi:4Fe-4S binding protein [Aeromicrobium sp. YIM 150415]|uniref:ferredoxin n=1 Tax=Aeromicrobium sp. YIM 150415 TaxID=2803912 RepID=UPI0019649922|nr:ferredoxin [Aeromicrobium sp. YIM 150415]MBM9463570.1 4Fe-4S binding protein [Aeromicrobium sp. YIM 150415]